MADIRCGTPNSRVLRLKRVQLDDNEDVALTRQLLKSHSVADMHQIYSQYLQTAFQQYRDQSEKVVQRSESIHLAATTEAIAKEAARARH
jgi:hypothetical protein